MENDEVITKIRDYIKKQREDSDVINTWLNNVFLPNYKTIVEWIETYRPDFENCEKEMELLVLRLKGTNDYYKKLETINSQIDEHCDWSKNYLNLLYQTIKPYSFSFLTHLFFDVNFFHNALENEKSRPQFVHKTLRLRDECRQIDNEQLKSIFSHLENFSLFKCLENNFVIVGANGSGKSSFSRKTKQILNNVVIIASQKVFSYRSVKNFSLGNRCRQNLQNYQSQDKLYKNEDFNGYMEDLQRVLEALFEEKNELANKLYDGEITERVKSTLEKVICLWNELLPHRFLVAKNGDIQVQENGGTLYAFDSMSDGEKAVFYYIAHILLAKENSYIIVDEPENHLHLALIMKLWDSLELARPDCQFIYLTHNLEFAASRNNAEKIWMKRFIAPDKWEMEKLPSDKDLPEILYMELLGSRKPILFCEGTKASLDYKLYTRLFPNYTVIPADGHLQVISYTKAFNNSCSIHHNRAIGIIDGDFHKDEQKEAWKKDNIYCLDVQEVENILCDEDMLNQAVDYFHADQNALENAKGKLFAELQRHIDSQCAEYTVQMINNRFKENMVKNSKDLTSLKNSIKILTDKMLENVDALIDERKACLQKIIDARDFAEGIKRFNNKGLMAILTTDIEKDYRNRVFKMLDKNPDLLDTLKNKYFADIPQNL